MLLLFKLTILLSALLIFWVQPMVSKSVLPFFGGSPAVWTTAMLFFQSCLLLGYLYSHYAVRRLKIQSQVIVHSLLLFLSLMLLPVFVRLPLTVSATANPAFELLKVLGIVIAYPFLIASASSPLLQYWFSRAGGEGADDPYFLYAASNIGSFLALLSFPLLLEPLFSSGQQRMLWALLYIVLIVLLVSCGLLTSRKSPREKTALPGTRLSQNGLPGWRRRLTWLLLAFIPSSLMLAVTNHLSSDIASIPLLWVIPLSLYLLSFVIVFARRPLIPDSTVDGFLPGLALLVVFIMLTGIDQPLWLIFGAFLGFFFCCALVCHGRLAADRPPAENLTLFYFYLALGGMLGGVFNALLAPMLFSGITELPVTIVLAAMVYRRAGEPAIPETTTGKIFYWLPVPALGLLTALMAAFIPRLTLEPYQLWMLIIFGLPLVLAYLMVRSPKRYGLAVGSILIGSVFFTAIHGQALFRSRNFFGYLQVNHDQRGPFNKLFHGTTIHGLQFTIPERQFEPLAYYHQLGPFGETFAAFRERFSRARVGVIGLGIGSMLSYAEAEDSWTFYEINPAVLELAGNPRFFTFLSETKLQELELVAGDARLELAKAPPAHYDLLVVDAFSSDAIPTHLITLEAFELYWSKISRQGILAVNISNRYLDLTRVIADLAAKLGLFSIQQLDTGWVQGETDSQGKFASQWAVMARHPALLEKLLKSGKWSFVPGTGNRVWTDDYSNIVSIVRWR